MYYILCIWLNHNMFSTSIFQFVFKCHYNDTFQIVDMSASLSSRQQIHKSELLIYNIIQQQFAMTFLKNFFQSISFAPYGEISAGFSLDKFIVCFFDLEGFWAQLNKIADTVFSFPVSFASEQRKTRDLPLASICCLMFAKL